MNSTRLATLCAALGLASFLNPNHLQSQTVTTNAIDNAGNYSSGWTNGANGGTGFGPWNLSSGGGAAGNFVGNPSSAGITGMNSNSFGLYANGAGGPYVNAERIISSSLDVGQTLSFKWSINYDSGGSGNKGFNLLAGTNEIFNINNGGSAAITLNGTNINFSYGTAAMTWSFTRSGSNSIFISANSRDGSGSLSTNVVVSNASIDKIKFYASSLQSGDAAQPYFNDFLIITTTADTVPPVVTLSQKLVAVPVGGSYTADPGRSATDNVDTIAPSSITNNAATAVNLAQAGTYTVTYSAKDAANNTGTATQTVVVHPVGTFASQYNSVAAPGLFNGWANDGSRQNRLFKYENFKWRLLYYFDAAAGTNAPYLITANNGYAIKWGIGGTRGAGDASLNPTVDAAGWYVFELNELTDSASFAKLPTTDSDGDGMPNVWETFFGAQVSPTPLTDLDKDTIYNSAVGGTKTALQAFQTGDNPSVDAVSPTINLASNIQNPLWLAIGTGSGQAVYTEADVTKSDNIGTPSVQVVHRLVIGPNPGVIDAVDTTTDGLWQIEYTATDLAGNTTTVSRIVVVGDIDPVVPPNFANGYRKIEGAASNTISTIGSTAIKGQIFISGATPGTGQAPNISAELGVIASNAITGLVTADPSTWTGTGVWTTANYNSAFTGGDDEYQSTINGSGLTAGTYYYAFRFKIGEGAWRYAGIGGPWGTFGANTYGNGTLTVTAAQARNVTFAVNMGVQRELGNFNPASDKVFLVGDAVGDWATGVEMLREGSTDVFKITRPIEGALGTTLNYKFKSGNGAVGNGGYEGDVNPDPAPGKDTRVLTLGAVDSPQDEGTAFFNNVSQVRNLTFKVDMGVQVTKNEFAHGETLEVRFGDFNVGGKSLTREGSTTVYSGTFAVAGDAGGNFQYKFWKTNAAKGAVFERVDAPRTNSLLNRTYTLASNGVAVTLSPTPFFSNDDGVGPVITLKGADPLNLTNGAVFTDPGATAADAAEGTSVDITGSGTVNTSVAGSYTVTYSASDAAGNAATPVTRTVIVAAAGDTTPPVISLTGSATVTVAWGGTYSDAGATATDNVDSSVTVNSSGTVNTAVPGTYTITYTAKDAANNSATPVTRTVTVSAPSSTPGADGLSGLLRYAFGANGPNDSVTRPTASVSGGNLLLTAIVRTNDSKLTVVGEAVTSLANYTNAPSITPVTGSASGVSQAGVPAGTERQAFTVPQGADTRKFLRLKATLAP